MSTVTKFEDLRCWQAARGLVKLVYVVSKIGELGKDFTTRDQLRRAALGSMNNIAEGFGRFGKKDSIKFLDIAQSSAMEVQRMLYVLSDLEYLKEDKINEIKAKADETKNRTLAFIKHLRTTIPEKKKNLDAINNKKLPGPNKKDHKKI